MFSKAFQPINFKKTLESHFNNENFSFNVQANSTITNTHAMHN